MDKTFNLVDEPWVPVAGRGLLSLSDIFSNTGRLELGGTPIEKIAMFKLLLAVAQTAVTPRNRQTWLELGADGLAQACLSHLEAHHDLFDLYGDRPFLQMPGIAPARVMSFGALLPHVASGNTTILQHSQVEHARSDAEKAMILLTQMGFSLGGKRTDNSVVLTPNYVGKQNASGRPSSGKAGPSLGFLGFLHSFLQGENLRETIWLNLMTEENIREVGIFENGAGVAPWLEMPKGENCPTARRLRGSLIGRLVPMARFCLLAPEGFHYSEGIAHDGYREGMFDPTMAINFGSKPPRALWANPARRPWRELTALLSFVASQQTKGFECPQLRVAVERARDLGGRLVLWSGGLRVSSNAGEQYTSGADDYVESAIELDTDMLGEAWFSLLNLEMERLESLAKGLNAAVSRYYKKLKADGNGLAGHATQVFWEFVERDFQALVDSCGNPDDGDTVHQTLSRKFRATQYRVYDQFCPNDTARQMEVWAECRPGQPKKSKKEV